MQSDIEIAVSKEINKLNETLRTCQLVQETLNTKGWLEIVEPLIDKMLNDILGAKLNGRWYGGLLDRAKKEEKREYYVGYKQALIDLHRRVYAYADNIKQLEDKRDAIISNAKPKYTTPMLDTRYGRDARKDLE